MHQVDQIYYHTAEVFSQEIDNIWASEEAMAKFYTEKMYVVELDRTNLWNIILRDKLADVWAVTGPANASLTGFDVLCVLEAMKGLQDYNIYTQVFANLSAHMAYTYDGGAARANLKELEAKYKNTDPSPFTPKAKMFKSASTDAEKQFNADLSSIKALKIIEKFSLTNSFRVSPRGSTPAFADSCNVSMIGSGGDYFLRVKPGYKVSYILWESAPRMVNVNMETGALTAQDIDYPFFSKTGGDTLNGVLFSRYIAYQALMGFHLDKDYVDVLPRMNSVMILTALESTKAREVFDKIVKVCPSLTFTEHSRPTA